MVLLINEDDRNTAIGKALPVYDSRRRAFIIENGSKVKAKAI